MFLLAQLVSCSVCSDRVYLSVKSRKHRRRCRRPNQKVLQVNIPDLDRVCSDAPILQGSKNLLQLSGFEVSPHRVRDFQLLLLLIKLPLEEVEINRVDNKILEFSDI